MFKNNERNEKEHRCLENVGSWCVKTVSLIRQKLTPTRHSFVQLDIFLLHLGKLGEREREREKCIFTIILSLKTGSTAKYVFFGICRSTCEFTAIKSKYGCTDNQDEEEEKGVLKSFHLSFIYLLQKKSFDIPDISFFVQYSCQCGTNGHRI